MLSSVEQAFVGRDEKRAPLKTPAWEAKSLCTYLVYVRLNSIYCIVVSSLLFSPSIYKSCFVIRLQLPSPRLVYKLFAGGKVM